MDDDVLVVGGGLAGCMTALAAARARSTASVGLVTRAETTLEQASGLIDVLGYTPDGEGPIADPFGALPDLPAEHPYTTVGVETVREGLALFDEVTGDRYAGDESERNALVPTYGGRVKPTARYPRSVEPGLASQEGSTTIIGFEQMSAFYAPLASERLEEILPYRVDGLMIEFPTDVTSGGDSIDTAPIECARALDDNEATENGETVREGIVDSLEYYLDMKNRAGFPAVLGLTETETIRETLTEELGLPIFEVPMGPPSVPGRRLQSMLGESLSEAGVSVLTGASVVDVDASDGAVDRVRLDGDHEPYEASQFVLATGGLTGGGIRSDREEIREPVFGCHVDAPPDRYDWFEDDAFGAHQFARFGVSTDDDMRPLSEDGDPEYRNLRAAGSVLGGYDFAAEKSGSGVSIATGYAAGTWAADDVA